MKKPVFFVQNNYVGHITEPLSEFVREHGYALEDRSSSVEFNPDDCWIDWSEYHPVMPYGSVQFVRKLKHSPALGKYILYSEEAFSTAYWTNIFGAQCVNYRGSSMTVKQVTERLAKGERMHVRPDYEDKAFIAKVFTHDSWQAICAERYLRDDLMCWASPEVVLHGEWRCWIIGGEVVEISQYRKGGKMHRVVDESSEVWQAARRLASIYTPAPCVVIDVALTPEGYQVLEFNPIHGAGWYAARLSRIIPAWHDWSVKFFGPAK